MSYLLFLFLFVYLMIFQLYYFDFLALYIFGLESSFMRVGDSELLRES